MNQTHNPKGNLMSEKSPLRLVQATVQNVLGVVEATITPDGAMTIVSGANGSGKTGLTEAISFALCGKKLPEMPVRNGQKQGSVDFEIARDGQPALRGVFTIPARGSHSLKLFDSNGLPVKSPRGVLNTLLAKYLVDPVSFQEADQAEQHAVVLKALGVDVDRLNAARKAAFEARTVANRTIDTLKKQLADLPFDSEAPGLIVSIGELSRKLAADLEANGKSERLGREADYMHTLLEAAKSALRNAEEKYDTARKLFNLTPPMIETGITQAKIDSAEADNAKVAANAHHSAKKAELTEAETAQVKTQSNLDAVDQEFATAAGEADLPIDGLEIDAEGLSLNGRPLDQACGRDQLLIGFGVGLLDKPQFPFVIIDNGERLDPESFRDIVAEAERRGVQVLMTTVHPVDTPALTMIEGVGHKPPDPTDA